MLGFFGNSFIMSLMVALNAGRKRKGAFSLIVLRNWFSCSGVRIADDSDVSTARAWLAEHISEIRMTAAGEGKNRHYIASGDWDLLGGQGTRAMDGCGGWI